ncbi:3-keto-disaccharide hydrolase [Synoicihabitans lomoniglobus]|uniref:DUF1080 domain-containing protein n=1 Tax=Synoicihabitans lomoniglobus TaxID=2909285 RepID=A0AAF0CSG0_9BACT|nr:DUF1080 domain-containing protein [Opitutaceae bacterium LMO-M01]WED67207.1 DUF1080 domain-containing protein [Opitutaceae bacterium LMO-M01]
MKRLPLSLLLVGSFLATSLYAQTTAWKSLFDGKTLTGWQANENPGTWVVEDGAIVTKGNRSHLFYQGNVGNHDFKNFEFSAEVMTTPGSNSGIYIHTKLAPDPWPVTGYECQVFNSSKAKPGEYSERKMTGSIYAVRNTWRAPAVDNEWFVYRIKVSGKTIQTFINDELICQYTEGADHWRADDKKGRRLSSGTIALQGHDPGSTVRYRNLRIRMLPADTRSLSSPLDDPELDQLLSRMADQNFALIDLGLIAETVQQQRAQVGFSRRLGFTLGHTLSPSATNLATWGANGSVLLVNDRYQAPSVPALKAAKASGVKIAFSSGGVTRLDPERVKTRLKAITAAGLSWQDLWCP